MAVHAAISMGLDFSPGMKLASEIQRTFNRSVHPMKDTGHFTMVVSFARHSFRLDVDNVGLALESAIGGYCSQLKVSYLNIGVFSFNVSCKEVGFFILHQRSFVCPQFKCFFHLWGHGGPDWEKEFRLWQSECNQEWTLVSPSKRRARLGLEAMQNALTKSSLCSRSSGSISHNHVKFATFMKYPARKGYNYGPTATEVATIREAGYEVSEREVSPSQVPASSPVATPLIQFGSLPPSPQGVSHACNASGFSGRLLFPATEILDSSP